MSNPPASYKPSPYFSGIVYNPTDFINNSKTAVLTYTDALTLFLQKNTPIPLLYSPSNITTTSQLGYRYQVVNATTATSSATVSTITQWASFTVPAGVWLYEAVLFINTVSVPFVEWYVSATTASGDASRLCGGLTTTVGLASRGTGVIPNASSATWYLNGKSNIASVSITNINVYLTRIG